MLVVGGKNRDVGGFERSHTTSPSCHQVDFLRLRKHGGIPMPRTVSTGTYLYSIPHDDAMWNGSLDAGGIQNSQAKERETAVMTTSLDTSLFDS